MKDDNLALEEARKAYNDYAESVLPADLHNREDLGFADQAHQIDDLEARNKFCRLAVAMLDANIDHHRWDAVPIKEKPENQTLTVASTLLVAGAIDHFAGLSTALIVAGIWYWLTAHTGKRRAEQYAIHVLDHNADVGEWRDTIQEWKAARNALQNLINSTTAAPD